MLLLAALFYYKTEKNNQKKYINAFTLLFFLAFMSATTFSSQVFIPNLRISLGGLKPKTTKIYLNKDCYLQTTGEKDKILKKVDSSVESDSLDLSNNFEDLSIEYKINNHHEVRLLYESNDVIIVEGDEYNVSIYSSCIQSILKKN